MMLIVQILLLLLLANGAPVIARKVLGTRWAWSVDGGRHFVDGKTWFGKSKTIRGILASVLTTSLGAVLIGYSVATGALFSIASMGGDLISSLIKAGLLTVASGGAVLTSEVWGPAALAVLGVAVTGRNVHSYYKASQDPHKLVPVWKAAGVALAGGGLDYEEGA